MMIWCVQADTAVKGLKGFPVFEHEREKKKAKKMKWIDPFTTPACKSSWLKVRWHPCKQSIFWSYYTSPFSAVRLDENPFRRQCEKENQKS